MLDQFDGPFLGCQGIGPRMVVKKGPGGLIIRETYTSQLGAVITCLACGPGLIIFALFNWSKLLKENGFGFGILLLLSGVGCIVGVKFLSGIWARHRIEVDVVQNKISLLQRDNSIVRQIQFKEIRSFAIFSSSVSRAKGGQIQNFTLRLTTLDGQDMELCMSDSKQNIELIRTAFEASVPRLTA